MRFFLLALTLALLTLGCSHNERDFFNEEEQNNSQSYFNKSPNFDDYNIVSFNSNYDNEYENQPATRGISIDTTNMQNFGVLAYYMKGTTLDATTPSFMYNQIVTKTTDTQGNLDWVYSPLRYWPSDVATNPIEFFAYSPHNTSATGISISAAGLMGYPSISYTANNDVTNQHDLLFAKASSDDRNADGSVDLDFKHLLTKVNFSIKGSTTKKITNIQLTDIVSDGTYEHDGSDYGWVPGSTIESFDVNQGDELLDVTSGSTNTAISTDNGQLFMIPQELNGKTMKVTISDGSTIEFKTFSFTNADSWDMGASVNYCFNFSIGTELTFAEISSYCGDGGTGGYPDGDTWVIQDSTENNFKWSDLRTILNRANAAGKKINLVFPTLESFPAESSSSLGNCKAFTISAPMVTTIPAGFFSNCSQLTGIDLPNVTSVDKNAFNNCDALVHVNLPKATTIGITAFQGCNLLETVTLPQVTGISEGAFNSCPALTILTVATDPGVKYTPGNTAIVATTINPTVNLVVGTLSEEYINTTGLKDNAISNGYKNFGKSNFKTITTVDNTPAP